MRNSKNCLACAIILFSSTLFAEEKPKAEKKQIKSRVANFYRVMPDGRRVKSAPAMKSESTYDKQGNVIEEKISIAVYGVGDILHYEPLKRITHKWDEKKRELLREEFMGLEKQPHKYMSWSYGDDASRTGQCSVGEKGHRTKFRNFKLDIHGRITEEMVWEYVPLGRGAFKPKIVAIFLYKYSWDGKLEQVRRRIPYVAILWERFFVYNKEGRPILERVFQKGEEISRIEKKYREDGALTNILFFKKREDDAKIRIIGEIEYTDIEFIKKP